MSVPTLAPCATARRVANVVAHTVAFCCRYIVIDLAFVLQGNEEEELPEHILGSARLSRIDLDRAQQLTSSF